jgi:lysophospholipase L1-like esterase
MRSGVRFALSAAVLLAIPAAAQAPPPPALTGATVRQNGEDVVARLAFSAPLPSADAAAGHRVCVTFRSGRAFLHGMGARVARRRHGTWVLVGPARARREGDAVVVRAPARSLRVALGRSVRWTAASDWDGARQTLTGTLRTWRLVPFAPKRHLRLLATGDSMIQVVDGMLRARLPHHHVISEAHISSGISKPGSFGIDWVRHAGAQARAIHPDATVMFLGPNEGFPIGGVSCCGRAWIARYAGRAETMMRAYRRHGRALVYWLTLPAPRGAALARVLRAVNAAILRAAKRAGSGVHVIDTRRVFTPNGRFRQTACYRGRCFSARQPDGVHLSIAGARVAADMIARRLRADRAIR